MDRRLLRLALALRGEEAPVSTAEVIDAAQAMLAVGVARRDDLRVALRASLVKDTRFLPEFDLHFDRLFPAGIEVGGRRRRRGAREAGEAGGARASSPSAAGIRGGAEAPPRDAPDGATQPAPPREEQGERPGEAGRTRGEKAPARAPGERRRLLAKSFRERWTPQEERAVLEAMEELARRLATRLARRRRRSRRGAVDLKATLRANLGHGGVPLLLRRRSRKPGRRDLVLLADVSGSVRRAAGLFLLLIGHLRSRFSGVRAFAYVDRPGEITAGLSRLDPAGIAAALAAALPLDALSDHGETFRRFNRDFPGAVRGRTTVVILGDGRNNRFPAQEWELEAIRRRSHRLWWLVPEPESLWGSADSAVRSYAPHCHRMAAAPNAATLAREALRLARGR